MATVATYKYASLVAFLIQICECGGMAPFVCYKYMSWEEQQCLQTRIFVLKMPPNSNICKKSRMSCLPTRLSVSNEDADASKVIYL